MSFNGVEEVYCALYVDFDNIFTRLYELDPELAHEFGSNPKRWIRWIEGHAVKILYGENVRRRILKRVCYLNPRRYQEYRSNFTMAAFQVVDCPPMTRQEKTSTDIHLVMDCLDALHHQTHFGEFIILSGDSDFTPLLLRLQEYARKTLVLSVGYTSPAYASAATWRIREDWFIAQSLEKEEDSSENFDDYDMDNHYEMLSMSQYRTERESRLDRTADGGHGKARRHEYHNEQYADNSDNCDNHDNNDERSHSRSQNYSHERPKRYDRKERDSYEGRQSFGRDYERQSFSTKHTDAADSDAAQSSSYSYANTYKGRQGRKARDEWAAYNPKKYFASHQYQSQQDYDEESQVTIPVKVISYADVKKPTSQDVLDTQEESPSSFAETPTECHNGAHDEAGFVDTTDTPSGVDATDFMVQVMSDDEGFAEEQCKDANPVQKNDKDAQGLEDGEDILGAEDDSSDMEQESSNVEATSDKADYDLNAQGPEDESLEDDSPDSASNGNVNSDKSSDEDSSDEEYGESGPSGQNDDDGPRKVFQGLSAARTQGYASYASTLRQHGYVDDVHDFDDDLEDEGDSEDEMNGNIAEPTVKPSIFEQAITILKKVVTESPQPVPAANIGQILQRELGAGLDWFGFGKLRDFLDHLDLAPLEFSPVPPGYLYDPNRHDRPEERGNNDEFRVKYPELFDFALKVHRLTDMPLLLPEYYRQVLGYIVEEVNTNGFFMTTTSRNVRDRCIEDGLPVARSHVNFIIVGVGRGGCPLNDKQGISMRDVAKAFLRNAYDLCRVAHMDLGEQTMHQLMEWIMPKE